MSSEPNNYYVDISDGVATGAGTELSPWNWSNLLSAMSANAIVDYDIVRIKGTHEETSVDYFIHHDFSATHCLFTGWDTANNGYWKVRSTGAGQTDWFSFVFPIYWDENTFYFKDLVVENIKVMDEDYSGEHYPAKIAWLNCIFIDDFTQNEAEAWSSEWNGCTFINGSFYLIDYITISATFSGTFNDCVSYNYIFNLSGDSVHENLDVDEITFNNCVFSGASADMIIEGTTDVTISACQFSWTPGTTMPSFTAISASDKSNLTYEDFDLPERSLSGRSRFFFYDDSNTDRTVSEPHTDGSLNYLNGSYMSPRFGPGSFYFTDIGIYVDLSAVTSGNAGTSADPYNWDDFKLIATYYFGNPYVADNDEFYLRGEKNIGNINGSSNSFSDRYYLIDAWDASAYGPWRMYDTSGNVNFRVSKSLRNGIVEFIQKETFVSDLKLQVTNVENMFIEGTKIIICPWKYCALRFFSDIPQETYNIGFSGCTLVSLSADEVLQAIWCSTPLDTNMNITFKDTVLDCSAVNGTSSINYPDETDNTVSATFDFVATSAANQTQLEGNLDSATFSNMQYGWRPDTGWPSYSASSNSFLYSSLGSGITISGSYEW